jgi:asparagine synthase (glutamine-hydrolysing)
MCGISCVIDRAARPDLREEVAAMHSRIRHRGPDGEGFVFAHLESGSVATTPVASANVAAAFRWLKIQDTSDDSSQPFASPDGRVHLLFNGEIYNFRELREELASLGDSFTTRSDTEVVLAAYRKWGTSCFERLRGMWAIVIVDLDARRIVVSRDRLGIKPLYFESRAGRVRIASEVKQLVAPGRAADREMLLHFLAGSRLAGRERTFFEDIRAVPPGTFAIIRPQDDGALRFTPFWSLEPRVRERSYDDAFEEFRALMTEVVRQHITAEVPVATFLSGGIDSSVVTAVAQATGARLPALSMVLEPEFARYDEARYIDSTVRHLGLRNERVTVTGALVRDTFDAVCETHEEPLAGIALVAQSLTYRLAAQHGIRVVLDGQGSDEEFAGYPRQAHEYLLDLFLRGRIFRGAAELRAFRANDASDTGRFLRYAASVLVARPLRLRRRTQRLAWLNVPPAEAERLSGSERASASSVPGDTRLARMLWADTMSLNMYDVLGIGDRNSMAHSVESRVPFVDHVLVEFAFSLPDHMKAGAGWRKRILRRLAAERVPPEVAWRVDKMGFAVPQAIWMRRHFADEIASLADRRSVATSALFHREAVRGMATAFLAGANEPAMALWRILATARWSEIYGVALD